jgi:hypothetical protein
MDPMNDVAGDIGTADTASTANVLNTKLIDLENCMKLTREFTIGDTSAGSAGYCTTSNVDSNYLQAAIPDAEAKAADTPSCTTSEYLSLIMIDILIRCLTCSPPIWCLFTSKQCNFSSISSEIGF